MVQEDVVQLQVTVDDSLFMEEVQSNADFSSIKSEEKRSKFNKLINFTVRQCWCDFGPKHVNILVCSEAQLKHHHLKGVC